MASRQIFSRGALLVVCASCSPGPVPAPGRASPSPAPSGAVALSSSSSARASASAAPVAAELPACPSFAPARASSVASVPAAAERSCQSLAAASVKKVQAAGKEAPAWLSSSWPGVGRCVGDGGGAWLLAVESMRRADEGFAGSFRVVRVGADGRAVRTSLVDDFGTMKSGERRGAAITASVDIDGDGAFELLLTSQGHYAGGEDASSAAHLYRLAGKQLSEVPLPLAKGLPTSLVEVSDVDGDGRPDLIVESPFSLDVDCTLDGTASGPRLLLHGGPGGFVVDDEVTQNFARRECAGTSLATLVTLPASLPDSDSREGAARTIRAIGCARLGGAPASEVKEQLRREVPADPHAACVSTLEQLSAAADVVPPLTVSRLACRR